MPEREYVNCNSKQTKKQLRQDKRELKQIGNQQKRTREKNALRDLVEGNIDFIPDFDCDEHMKSESMNGLDKIENVTGEPEPPVS